MAPELKKEVEEAAALIGSTFTSFATESLIQRARQIKRDYALTVLGREDWAAFVDLMTNPPEPSPELLKLMTIKVER